MPRDIKRNNRKDNESVKDIKRPFMLGRVSFPPLAKINHSINRANLIMSAQNHLNIPPQPTHQYHRRSKIRHSQYRLPISLQLLLSTIDNTVLLATLLNPLVEARHEPLTRKVEAHSNDAEKTKARELYRYTDLRNLLAFLGFGHEIDVVEIDARDVDCADELETQSHEVAEDKDSSEPAGGNPEKAGGS